MRSTMTKVAIGLLVIAALLVARFPVRSAAGWDGDQVQQIILTVVIVFLAALLAGGFLWLILPRLQKRPRTRRRQW